MRPRNRYRHDARRAAAAVALIAACLTARAADETPAATLADDGFHRAAWADGRHDASYTEWWYFNLDDPRAGVQAIFSYFVTNPGDLAGLGQAQMVAVAGTPEGGVSTMDAYPPETFSASAERADVTIDPGADSRGAAGGTGAGGTGAGVDLNTVRVADDGRYLINGGSRDGRLRWDLMYAPEAAPWPAFDSMPVGRLAWEKMSWLVFMPRARVTGTLTVDGRQYVVDASGYHDHNWGEWIPTDALWNWAQFSTPSAALEIGDFIGKPIGVVSLDLDGERTVFTRDQYSLVHTRWAWDAANRLLYPVESLLTADNGILRVQVTLRAIDTAPLRGDLPAPLKDLIIYEQTARYSGAVWSRTLVGAADANAAAAGEWRQRAILAGTGFKEYTAKHY
ncbi:MAG TPA: hypothetical protein VFB49_11765 [Patescibacteria group bacterium]|nr:hypothetical protein [Patescibacteria group bacterium]